MKTKLLLLIVMLMFVCAHVFAEDFDFRQEQEQMLNKAKVWVNAKEPVVKTFAIGGSLGMNYLQRGYDSYKKDYPDFGVDLKVIRKRATQSTLYDYRISFEYFPLVVPEGTYGLTEDIYSISGSVLFNFYRHKYFTSYAGIGPGLYLDHIRLDTPVSGEKSTMYAKIGLNASVGMIINTKYGFKIYPEVRYHTMFSQKYMASHMSIQCGVMFNIR